MSGLPAGFEPVDDDLPEGFDALPDGFEPIADRDIRPLAKQRLDRLTSGDPALGDAPPPQPQGPPSLRQIAAGRRDKLVASQLPQTEAPDTPLYHPLRAIGRHLAEQNPTNPITVGDMVSAPFKVVQAMRESKNPYFSGIGEWAQEPVAKVSKLTDIYADNPALSFVPGAPPPEAVRMAGRVAEPFTSPEMLASFGVPGTGFGGLAAKVPAFGTAALLHGAAELPEQTQQLLAQTIAGDKEGLRETLPEWGTNAAFTALAGRHMLGRQEAHDAQREAQKDAAAQETAQETKAAVEQPAVNKAPTHEEAARAEEWRAAEWEAAQRAEAERVAAEQEGRAQQWRAAEWDAAQRDQPAEIPQNAPGGAEQGGMQPASFPVPPDVKLSLAKRLAAQRAAREGVDAGPAPVQPPPAASGPAEPAPAGPAPAEVAAEPVGRPAVAPAEERLAPESKEQLDAQLAAVGDGAKPGVFYPVQNGHEVPDTPAGLARVNGEQGSLIFDPKRVPAEKAQRAVDTGENLHEVIGMSGPREGVTDPEPGMVRLYRMGAPGEHEGRPPTKKADWIEQDPRYQATLKASGRWFTDDRAEAEWYKQEHPEGQLYYVDVPATDVEGYRVGKRSGSKDTPDNPAAYSLRPEKELFLPPDVAARKRPFAEAVAVTTRDARGVPITDEQTADPQRAIATATPPPGGSVETRPLAAVIEERQAAGAGEGLATRVARQKAEAAGEGPKTAAEWARKMATLRETKPRPLDKLYGKRGPTPEQKAEWDAATKAWNASYRRASLMQKKTLAEQNRTAQVPVEAEPEAPRERLVREAKDAGMGTPEQVDAVAQVWDARAKQWAKETGQSVGQFFQKFFGGVKKGGAPKGSLKQGEAPVFYSKLRRVVEGMKSPVTPDQLRGYLKAQGVKAEEMEWTNLDSALEGKRLVRPEELLKHLDANEVKLEEVQHGTTPQFEAKFAAREAADNAAYERMAQARMALEDAASSSGVVVNPNFSNNSFMLRPGTETRTALERAGLGDHLREYDKALDEWVKTSEQSWPQIGGETKYEQYQVPGGEGYHELLLTLPRKTREVVVDNPRAPVEVKQNVYGDGKWRLVDKTGEWSGESYHSKESAEAALREARARGAITAKVTDPSYQSQHWDEPNVLVHVRANSRDGGKTLHLEEIQSDWHQQGKRQGYATGSEKPSNGWDSTGSLPPDAPFKKTWPELALKRMLRYAAENGYERVTWTTGETQAERYDLSKQISEARWEPRGTAEDGRRVGLFEARDANGNRVMNDILAEDKLPDHIGKELADRIIQRSNRHPEAGPVDVTLSGLDLKVGGEGMKGFYDKILPSVANGLAKKFGARVGEHTIEGDVKVHSLEVTKAMRDSVMEGQPLFQKAKGAVSFMEDGKAVIHALEQPDVSTFIHETAHVFRRTLADADRAIAERAYGVKDGEWKRPHEERWATDFEHYTMTGKAPTTALARVFEQFKQWLADIYKSVKGTEVHPEIKALFDRMLGGEEKPTETLAERKRRMDAEIQATGDDLRSLDGLKAIIKEVDRPTKLRLLQKAIPGAGPRTKQWAYDELERVRQAEAPVDLAPTPERKANVRADELVTKVLGENIGAMRRQAAMGAIDELVAGRPATKGVFTLPEENAVRAELGLPARKLAVKKGGVAVAPLPGAKSLGAGAGGSDMTSPLGHGFLGRAIDSAKAVGKGVAQGVAKFKGKETPGASVDIGDPVDANPIPRGVPNTLPDSVVTTGGAKRNISNLAEARNLFGGGQQNTINVESPEAAAALRMAAVHTAAARTVHQETMKKMEGLAKDGLRKQGLKGDELVTAARDRVYDTLRWLSGSNQEGLHQRWIDLKEAAGKLNDKDFLSAARDSEIKTPIEALSQKKWLFEDYADEKLATALAKAVKEKDAERAREIVDDAYGRAIEAHREQTFSDPKATMDSIEAEPWLKPMLEAWDNGTGKLLEQVHRSNEGIFRQEKYLGRAKRYFPGIEAEAPTKAGGIRRPEHANQTNPDNKFATGISETGYSIAPEDIIHSASRSLFVNGRAAAEQALLDAGVSYDLPPGAEPPKTMLYKGREVEAKVEPTQTLWRMRRDGKLEQAVDLKYRVYPAQIHREMSPIFAPGVPDPHTFLKRVVDNINSAQMAGLTDLSAHVTNQILTLFNNATPIFAYAHKKASSAEQGNYVGNLLKAMWADLDSPEVQARMREMAMNGQLHPATGASTFYTDQADFLGIHDAVKPFGKEWLNVFPVDPKTGKRSLRLLPADLGPLLTGTGRGMDLALDTRIRVLLDQVGEHIFESTNPGKKWADNPQLRFDFTKQLGIYHRGLEGRLIEFMKDVPIFGRFAPFATAGTTFNRNGIAALFGGTFEMPVGEGAKAQVLNRYRAYGVAAGIAAPVATWVLLYKQHTGKYPWEDERSKFMQIPINDETRKSAFGRQLWGDDMTKTAYLNLGKYTPFTRGLRVTGARNFNPLDKAKEGLDTKDRALMAFTDIINGWLHPWTGPAVGMASVASSGFEPRFQYSPKVGRPALSPAYRGKWSPGKNLKASVLHGNPMVANYHRAKLEDRTTFGSVVDSVASGLLQNSRTPASKLEKLLTQRTPLVTKEMSDEKLAEYDYIRKTTAALRHGEDKDKVMADLREKVKAGFIGEGKAKDIVEAAAMPDWYDDFEGANVEDAADAWLVATPEQRKRLGGIMGEKVKHWQGLATQKNLSKTDRDRIKTKIAKAVAVR